MTNEFKSGYIGIVGRPNVGKSTLLNALVGQKIAIISPKPQTTRNQILAIASEPDCQMVFLDTPGFHKPKNKLGQNMIKAVDAAIADVDLLLMVIEPIEEPTRAEQTIVEKLGSIPTVLVVNKADSVRKDTLLPVIAAWSSLHEFVDVVPLSARTGDGIDTLKAVIREHLAPGPQFFPEDMVTDQQEKQIVAEIIREKLLNLLEQEVPHGIAIEIVKMKQTNGKYDISANIYCEKDSHKGIIIGAGGRTLKEVGTLARTECEAMLDAKVFLELWVKVKADWRNSNNLMREFGLADL